MQDFSGLKRNTKYLLVKMNKIPSETQDFAAPTVDEWNPNTAHACHPISGSGGTDQNTITTSLVHVVCLRVSYPAQLRRLSY